MPGQNYQHKLQIMVLRKDGCLMLKVHSDRPMDDTPNIDTCRAAQIDSSTTISRHCPSCIQCILYKHKCRTCPVLPPVVLCVSHFNSLKSDQEQPTDVISGTHSKSPQKPTTFHSNAQRTHEATSPTFASHMIKHRSHRQWPSQPKTWILRKRHVICKKQICFVAQHLLARKHALSTLIYQDNSPLFQFATWNIFLFVMHISLTQSWSDQWPAERTKAWYKLTQKSTSIWKLEIKNQL